MPKNETCPRCRGSGQVNSSDGNLVSCDYCTGHGWGLRVSGNKTSHVIITMSIIFTLIAALIVITLFAISWLNLGDFVLDIIDKFK